MSMSEWNQEPGEFSVCIGDADGVDGALGEWLAEQMGGELVIHFESTGYYEPAQTCGPPEKCYPAEYDEERTVTKAVLIREDDTQIEVPKEFLRDVELLWEKDMYEVELPEPDEPERWRDADE